MKGNIVISGCKIATIWAIVDFFSAAMIVIFYIVPLAKGSPSPRLKPEVCAYPLNPFSMNSESKPKKSIAVTVRLQSEIVDEIDAKSDENSSLAWSPYLIHTGFPQGNT